MALEWQDVDLDKRQLCVERSDWKGHVTVPKGGRLRHVPLTGRVASALARAATCEARGCSAMPTAAR
jgi:integrase